MNNWQEWVVALLLTLCVVRIVYSVWRFFRRTRSGGSPCGSCPNCCSSKHSVHHDSSCCCSGEKKKKKSCCE